MLNFSVDKLDEKNNVGFKDIVDLILISTSPSIMGREADTIGGLSLLKLKEIGKPILPFKILNP